MAEPKNDYIQVSAPAVARAADGGATVSVSFRWRGEERRLWFSVEAPYADSLTPERSDGFLVALLSWAMHVGANLRFTAPVSRKLFFAVTRFLLPTLHVSHPWDQLVRLDAPLADAPVPTGAWTGDTAGPLADGTGASGDGNSGRGPSGIPAPEATERLEVEGWTRKTPVSRSWACSKRTSIGPPGV